MATDEQIRAEFKMTDWAATEKKYRADGESAAKAAKAWKKFDGKMSQKFEKLAEANNDIAEHVKEKTDGAIIVKDKK